MLKELSYVVAVAQTGSVSKAAENLFISQPSLSRYIRDLESRLGVQLFQRVGNRVSLTYAGEKYVETSKQILALYENLERDLKDVDEALTGRLKVGCALVRMSYNIPPILKAFIDKFPKVDLQLYENYTTKGLESMLLNGEIDVAIINQGETPKLSYIPFFSEELLLVVPPTQSIAVRGIRRPECVYPWMDLHLLDGQPYIRLHGDQAIAMKVNHIFEEYNIHPSTILTVKSIESAFRLAEAGVGSAIVPETLLSIPSVDTPPKVFSFGHPITIWTLSIAYREGSTLSSVAMEFIHLVKKRYETMKSPGV